MNQDQVIAKIRKTLALANGKGGTEHEREAAMRQAFKLLAKYNLDMAQIEGAEEPDRAEITVEFYQSPFTRRMARAIAELFFCKYLYFKGTKSHLFIGSPANSTTAAEMAQYVVKSVIREGNRTIPIMSERTSFMYGAADMIMQRCHNMRMEAERASQQEATAGTALVLASVYQQEAQKNEDYFAEKYGGQAKTAKSRNFNRMDAGGYAAGAEYGSKINLNRQVGTTAKATRLK